MLSLGYSRTYLPGHPCMQDSLYKGHQLIISEYSDGAHTKYKLVYMPTLRNSGVEEPEILPGDVISPDGEICEAAADGEIVKLAKNVYRARSTIYELAFCNSWDWFFTGTIDGSKHDRSNLDEYRKNLAQFVRDVRKRVPGCENLKYLFVPELHGDRENWHVHGFLSGLPASCLHRFQLGDQMSSYIATKVKNRKEVYSWEKYAKKFGFCDLEPIQSHDGACKYVTKYISKALDKSVSDLGKHMFYASQGLERRRRVYCDDIKPEILEYMKRHPQAYHGDYTVCLWLDSLKAIEKYLQEKEE